jgi:hypothetical protein
LLSQSDTKFIPINIKHIIEIASEEELLSQQIKQMYVILIIFMRVINLIKVNVVKTKKIYRLIDDENSKLLAIEDDIKTVNTKS